MGPSLLSLEKEGGFSARVSRCGLLGHCPPSPLVLLYSACSCHFGHARTLKLDAVASRLDITPHAMQGMLHRGVARDR